MQELEDFDGIYSIGPTNGTTENPLVVVHPYFFTLTHAQARRHGIKFNQRPNIKYLMNLENHIIEHDGPVIVLEEEEKVQGIIAELRYLGRDQDTYIIPTENQDPYPVESNWEDVIDFVSWFASPVNMCGGIIYKSTYQHLKAKKPICSGLNHGCLGFTAIEFKKSGLDVEILREATFSLQFR